MMFEDPKPMAVLLDKFGLHAVYSININNINQDLYLPHYNERDDYFKYAVKGISSTND